ADGVCRPYDAAATGQVFGNGGGAVVLKRLGEAVEDGDHIHAVLAGWAVNNDGADRAGFTVPGVTGQAAVVAEALAAAGWDPADVGFVEGHGTGTAVGDAIEIEALTRAFRTGTTRSGYCALGSVKSTVGNLDAAAGVVGLINAVYAVRHGVIPPTPHFTRAHPDVELDASPFVVSTATRDWPGPRRAGVSSFGLGGTNAHVLVEEAPQRPAPVPGPDWSLLPLCAGDAEALRCHADRLAAYLADRPTAPVADVAYTLAVGRRPLPSRAAIVCRDAKDAIVALSAIGNGHGVCVPDDAPGELREAAAAWVGGGEAPVSAGQRASLPGYPFQRRRHWIDPPPEVRP
ncbi:MAG TPA: ketoacyl-synthetase C-terminal extension domain-containing protein, partial [Pilimelia sp.]|nr:ketoacyl-synthetase C-terminal extension domain-containing protein [Pilimelia sp.]